MTPEKLAVFDCDDVLAELRFVAEQHVSTILNRPVYHEVEFTQFNLINVYGHLFDVSKMFHSIDLEQLPIEPYAKLLIDKLKHDGWRVDIVTARGGHSNSLSKTENWCINNNLNIDNIHVVPMFGCKRDTIASLGTVEFFVDDNPDHIEKCYTLPNVKQCFLMDRPWNQQSNHPNRIYNLKEIYDMS